MTSDFSSRAGQYEEALTQATAGIDAEPLQALALLLNQAPSLAAGDETASAALDALAGVAARNDKTDALSAAASLFESPQRFREAIHFARALQRNAPAALDLLQLRRYLEAAVLPASVQENLSAEQGSLLEETTFVRLWREPDSLPQMLAAIERWRLGYVLIYQRAHREQRQRVEAATAELQRLAPLTLALERLNQLRGLGGQMAVAALIQYHELEATPACPAMDEDVADALATAPRCRYCGFTMAHASPLQETMRVAREVRSGLSVQLDRLSRGVLPRLAGSPFVANNARLRGLRQAIETGDASLLADSLDDGLVEFLRDLLDSPTPRSGLIDQLSRLFPEVTEANLDQVVEEFRRLVQQEMARLDGRLRLAPEDGDA